MELGTNSGFRAVKCCLQFLYGSFLIGFDSPLKFVVVDEGWSSTVPVVLEVRIFCRGVVELAVARLKESSTLATCIINVSSRFAHVVVLVPLVVDDCPKLGFTYHGW